MSGERAGAIAGDAADFDDVGGTVASRLDGGAGRETGGGFRCFSLMYFNTSLESIGKQIV